MQNHDISVFGCTDSPSSQDYLASFSGEREETDRVDLMASRCSDQGNTNHCTAYALGTIVEFLAIRRDRQKTIETLKNKQWENQLVYPATAAEEYGDSLQSALKSLKKYGIKAKTPYGIKIMRIEHYLRITKGQVAASLEAGYPIYTGISLKSGYQFDKNGNWIPPKGSEDTLGGHAIAIVGFDFTEKGSEHFVCANSWGANWTPRQWENKKKNGTFKIKKNDIEKIMSAYIMRLTT